MGNSVTGVDMEIPNPTSRSTVGVLDISRVLLAPRRVFARVEDVAAYGWPLVILLAAVTLVGYATVQTGLVDREVDRHVEESIALLEKAQTDVVELSTLQQMIRDKRKEGEFLRLMTRVQRIVAAPVALLGSVLLLSAAFYGLVALSGKKPEWHTLMTIGVFASFVPLVGEALRFLLMLRFRSLEVDTSLSLIAGLTGWGTSPGHGPSKAIAELLSAADPFRMWFWLVLILGLNVTGQLRGWRAWLPCVFFWLSAAGLRAALAAA